MAKSSRLLICSFWFNERLKVLALLAYKLPVYIKGMV